MPLTHEQQRDRLTGIGASEAAAAIGLDPYTSQVELWLQKLGRAAPFTGNARTHWGNILEGPVRQEYAERTGRIVRMPAGTVRHTSLPFVLCHPDGVTDDHRLYEGKCTEFDDGWGEPGTDQVPERFLVQVQHAMLVCALPVADVAVLIRGCDFRLYEVPADRELQQSILDAEVMFWQFVERKAEPAVDYDAPGVLRVIKKLYPGTDGKTLTADEAAERWRSVYEDANRRESIYSNAKDAALAHLLYLMGPSAKLHFADGRALRRQEVKRKGYTVDPTSYMDARFVKDGAQEKAA